MAFLTSVLENVALGGTFTVGLIAAAAFDVLEVALLTNELVWCCGEVRGGPPPGLPLLSSYC